MKTLKGQPAEVKEKSYIPVGHLVYYEGPIVTLYRNVNHDLFLGQWIDVNYKVERWMLFEIEKKDLISFIKNRITYDQALFRTPYSIVYFIDKGKEKIYRVTKSLVNDVPEEYIDKSKKDKVFFNDVIYDKSKIFRYLNLKDET